MAFIIASDLDGTFLNRQAQIVPKNIDAIKKIQAAGSYFVVATGRPFISVQNVLEAVGTAGDPDQITLTLNGAVVLRNNGEVLYQKELSRSISEKVFNYGIQNNVCVHVYPVEKPYIYNLSQSEVVFLKSRLPFVNCKENTLELVQEPIYKVGYASLNIGYLEELKQGLLEYLQDDAKKVEISFSSERYLEVNAAGANKGDGLLHAADELGIPLENTVAIGDSLNDLEMLKAATKPFVVSNVADQLKVIMPPKVQILSSSCDDGAIAELVDLLL